MAIQQISSLVTAASQATVATRSAPAKESNSAAEASPVTVPRPDPEQLQQAVEQVRKAVEPVARNLRFSVDDDTGKTIVRVVDSVTKEVIRQIPSEELLAIARAIDRMQGLLIRQKA